MKDVFIASFFHAGVLGGAIYLQQDRIIYRTNKAQIEPVYRNLNIPYSSIERIETGWALFFPTVTLIVNGGTSYKFIIFHRKKFLSRLHTLRNTH